MMLFFCCSCLDSMSASFEQLTSCFLESGNVTELHGQDGEGFSCDTGARKLTVKLAHQGRQVRADRADRLSPPVEAAQSNATLKLCCGRVLSSGCFFPKNESAASLSGQNQSSILAEKNSDSVRADANHAGNHPERRPGHVAAAGLFSHCPDHHH